MFRDTQDGYFYAEICTIFWGDTVYELRKNVKTNLDSLDHKMWLKCSNTFCSPTTCHSLMNFLILTKMVEL